MPAFNEQTPRYHVTAHHCPKTGARITVAQEFIPAQRVYRGQCPWCGVVVDTDPSRGEDRIVLDAGAAAPAISADTAEVVAVLADIVRHYERFVSAEIAGSRDLVEKHRELLGEAVNKTRKLIKT